MADFWNNPNAKDDTPVYRHSPSDDAYVYPDARMMERMPHGRVGNFAVIPAANNDGTSKGFDIDAPGVVHVDPDAPDGGAIVDYSRVNGQMYHHALATSKHPHQVYYQLGEPPSMRKLGFDQQTSAPIRESYNPHLPPGSYVTPAATVGGGQAPMQAPSQAFLPISQVVPMQPHPMPSFPQPQSVAQPSAPPEPPAQPPQYPQPQPQYVQQQPPQYAPPPTPYQQGPYPQYAPPQYQPPQANQEMQELKQLVQGLAQTVAGMQRIPLPSGPASLSPNRMPNIASIPQSLPLPGGGPAVNTPPRRAAALDEYEEQQAQPQHAEQPQPQSLLRQQRIQEVLAPEPINEGLITGFETLQIPFLVGPRPEKAKQRVVFEFPHTGRQSGVYHAMVDSPNCVILVYDTRYEDGQQYMPPDCGDEVIKLTAMGAPKSKPQEFWVSSQDLHFSLGTLDFIVLIKSQPKDEVLDENE